MKTSNREKQLLESVSRTVISVIEGNPLSVQEHYNFILYVAPTFSSRRWSDECIRNGKVNKILETVFGGLATLCTRLNSQSDFPVYSRVVSMLSSLLFRVVFPCIRALLYLDSLFHHTRGIQFYRLLSLP